MQTITCGTGRSYDIIVGRDIIDKSGELIRKVSQAKRAVIISDTNVAPIYADRVAGSLYSAGFEPARACFKAGEKSKNLNIISEFYSIFSDAGITRDDIIIALGGGVTGDMAGFAAATWLRGVDFVQIPTSLLAQVDSSVGGKTGVDLPVGKNLVGAFWQPSLVICDIDTLKTLPEKYFTDGMAEIIKYGRILSKSLFEKLENFEINSILEDVISECISLKVDVVEKDERESDRRRLLNFGHTIGHAIEKLQKYEGLTHGQAVAVGMAYITKAGEIAGVTAPDTYARLVNLLQQYSLPIEVKGITNKQLCTAAMNDKKCTGNSINLVLLKEIGCAFIERMGFTEFEGFIGL